jgi:hypothetical protein
MSLQLFLVAAVIAANIALDDLNLRLPRRSATFGSFGSFGDMIVVSRALNRLNRIEF